MSDTSLHSIPFTISEEDASPVYVQLAKAIQEQIENGRLPPGARIPSERDFAAQHEISLATIRKALDHLVQKGLLNRVQGKGTFVCGTENRREKLRYYPFVKDFREKAFITQVEFIDLTLSDGQRRINRYLQIEPPERLFQVRRILLCEKKPMVYSVSYLPRRMFQGLSEYEPHRFEKYLYLFLEDEYGVSTIENEELYGVLLADDESARYLEVNVGHPLLRIEMIASTHKKKPYEYRKSYCLTNAMKIRRII